MLKDILPATLPVIINLMNTSFTSNCFVQLWKSAVVIPNLKSGDPNDPENTRHISILPMMSKVCERAAHMQFMDFLDKNSKISGLQSRNRKFHSTKKQPYHTSRTSSLRIWMKNEYLWLYYSTSLKLSTASDMTPFYRSGNFWVCVTPL